jgi:broad specificity phosphatase PhoE
MNFGAWEGKTYGEIAALNPELYQQWMDQPTEITFPGGECFGEMRARVLAVLRRLLSSIRENPLPSSPTAV